MIETDTAKPRRKHGWKFFATMFVFGGICGAGAGFLLGETIDAATGGGPSPSEFAALLVAVVYGMTALIVLAGLVNPVFGARFLNVEDADELIEQRRLLVTSGLGMLATAAFLLVLVFAAPLGPLSQVVVGVACAALLAAAAVASFRQHRQSDELMREVTREASVWGLNLLAGGLAAWGAAAHLGYTAGPKPLDLVTAIAAATLIGAVIAAGRRGLLAPR